MTSTKGCGHCPGSHTGERPCLATATVKAGAWLLVEHPGPWPEHVEDLSGPAPIAEVVRAAKKAGVRPQLIRRPGRRRPTPPLQVYAGSARGGEAWIEGRELADPGELALLDLRALAAGRSPGLGDRVAEPVLLVCTHGRHNACCARTGAPLARALATRFDRLIWETTHVGGDRFAANLVCLPHGLSYGDLGEAEATTAVDAYLRGEVVLDRLRGRAGTPEPAQAAEHFVREHTGCLGLDEVVVESIIGTSPYEAVVVARQSRYRVIMEAVQQPDPCGTGCGENQRTYVVRELTLLNEAALV
ncbi:sucrase ferredoxin [Actinomadura madurae]|uniref:sucrase ferredoxin n=1 Tax=Actinomadura madurae TaxID=1993 RepID=UPI0020D25BC7|nr:sucrase ferredoxin [Actinomadura madurae]MCP9948920.1 sucrase ferredoxin [Actinomadura madurae]MCP9965692.1 sucrase ferredoxin [Actinomadura madurae]